MWPLPPGTVACRQRTTSLVTLFVGSLAFVYINSCDIYKLKVSFLLPEPVLFYFLFPLFHRLGHIALCLKWQRVDRTQTSCLVPVITRAENLAVHQSYGNEWADKISASLRGLATWRRSMTSSCSMFYKKPEQHLVLPLWSLGPPCL